MTRVILIRHGQSSANVSGVLAGCLPDVHLSAIGEQQAEAAGQALASIRLAGIFTSPLERTMETAQIVQQHQRGTLRIKRDKRFRETDYGAWSGKALSTLVKKPLWRQIQQTPSKVTFPDGESMVTTAHRAIAGFEAVVSEFDSGAKQRTVAIVTHADIAKSILAHALGMHLDLFQRIQVDPGSLSSIVSGTHGTMVEAINLPPAGSEEIFSSVPAKSAPGGTTGKRPKRK